MLLSDLGHQIIDTRALNAAHINKVNLIPLSPLCRNTEPLKIDARDGHHRRMFRGP